MKRAEEAERETETEIETETETEIENKRAVKRARVTGKARREMIMLSLSGFYLMPTDRLPALLYYRHLIY